MKQLSIARLREMARRLELDVDARELARLRPMVQDVLEVGQRLRRDYAPPIDRPARRSG